MASRPDDRRQPVPTLSRRRGHTPRFTKLASKCGVAHHARCVMTWRRSKLPELADPSITVDDLQVPFSGRADTAPGDALSSTRLVPVVGHDGGALNRPRPLPRRLELLRRSTRSDGMDNGPSASLRIRSESQQPVHQIAFWSTAPPAENLTDESRPAGFSCAHVQPLKFRHRRHWHRCSSIAGIRRPRGH